MDVKGGRSDCKVDRDEIQNEVEDMDLRRGPWTVEEDLALMNYIANHGEGRWNSLARCAGLKRTGKSCRLRWLNYLRPDVRRGNITLEEQLLILELHSRWGNRWSKIAQHLPGRTDNEIKNYWRTRVQKHAKQLKCDVNSKQFKDTMRYLWMPRLVERIKAAAASSSPSAAVAADPSPAPASSHLFNHHHGGSGASAWTSLPNAPINGNDFGGSHSQVTPSYTPDTSSTAASSDSFGTQVSPVSDLTDYYGAVPVINVPNQDNTGSCFQAMASPSPAPGYFNTGSDFQASDLICNDQWINGGDASDSLWNVEDIWLLQSHYFNTSI